MSNWVKTDGGTVVVDFPYTKRKLREDFPNVSFKRDVTVESLADKNVFPVVTLPQPAYDTATQALTRDAQPTFNGGQWELGWTVRSLTQEELDDRARAKFEKDYSQSRVGLTDSDVITLLALYSEIQLYRSDNTADTPLIDAIKAQVFPGQTKVQIALTIESKAENFLVNAAVAFAQKVKDGVG